MSHVKSLFEGRTLVIATKHHKEKVIAPILEKELGVICMVPENFDTDVFGTFTGEVERKSDALETARRKCLSAMEITGCDLVVASEGSFGPHPTIFFMHADDEVLVLIDQKLQLEIIVRFLTTETNFQGSEIKSKQDLIHFANGIKFPTHALIMKKAKDDVSAVRKGLSTWEDLNEAFNYFMQQFQCAYVETDMRAMHNPIRMQFIEKVTEKLVEKVKSTCPQCQRPGFSISIIKEGLPCDYCGFPTRSPKSFVYHCEKCAFEHEILFPENKKVENPMFCNFCNP